MFLLELLCTKEYRHWNTAWPFLVLADLLKNQANHTSNHRRDVQLRMRQAVEPSGMYQLFVCR